MSRTGDVPIRYCNQCGKEEHGTAGCHTSVFQDKVYFPPAVYRLIGKELFKVDFVNLPPGARPFRTGEYPGPDDKESCYIDRLNQGVTW